MLYIDEDYKCHTSNPDGVFREVETDIFSGKCDAFIEGYRYIPSGESWVNEYGVVFQGETISPWKDYDELCDAQQEYEREKLEERVNMLEEELTVFFGM